MPKTVEGCVLLDVLQACVFWIHTNLPFHVTQSGEAKSHAENRYIVRSGCV